MTRRLLTILVTLLAALSLDGAAAPSSRSPTSRSDDAPSAVRSALEDLERELEEAYRLIQSREAAAHRLTADRPGTTSLPGIEMPDNAAIARAMQHFTSEIPGKIQDSLDRSTAYLPMIHRIFEEHGLPWELAYLPVIESSFETHVISRAGAKGMWQFTPDTARAYGLRVDWWVDERADPERSTRAAAQYLRELRDTFGDWSLALASYNAGPSRVRRTLDRRGADDYWSLHDMGALPRETRGYVPAFWATTKIVNDPARFGFTIAPPTEPDTTTLEIEGPVSLDWIASVAGIDRHGLATLNPAIRQGMTPPGPYTLRVPARVAMILAEDPTLRFDDPDVPAARYVARRGDSTTSLARRLRITSAAIRDMNNLPGSRLVAGQTIWLPATQADLSRLLIDTKGTTHIVRAGDTLYEIALQYGLSLAELLDLNDLTKRSVIHPGDRIRISAPAAVTAGGM